MSNTYYLEIESGCAPEELLEFLGLKQKMEEQPAALKSFRVFEHLEQLPGLDQLRLAQKAIADADADKLEIRARSEMECIQWLKNKHTDGQMDIIIERVAKLAQFAFELGRGHDPRSNRYDLEDDPVLSPTEKRLLELLTINDEKVYSANAGEQAAKLEKQEQYKHWAWAIHKELEEDPRPDLPLPRLELQVRDVTCPTQGQGMKWSSIEWLYCLVYPAFCGHVVFVPLGLTLERGGVSRSGDFPEPKPDGKGKFEPFREQSNMRSDMKTFSIPAYIVIEETDTIVPVQPFDLDRR